MTDDSLINRKLDEYQIESLLGKGGMARVYRGIDVRLKRYVAIKVVDTPYREEQDYITRFEREAQVIAQLEHPNVVRLYRYGDEGGFLYMVMQYIDGADLATLLHGYRQDNEFMQPDEIIKVIGDVCRALDYVHSKGVVHRDIKPSNIMLDRQGNAILADFGLALLTEAGTLGETFGSPHYIAPEQVVSSAKAEARSDLYALGVILFEIFTGQVPFDDADPLELAMKHLSESPPLPHRLRPEISPQIEAVILKAMSKEKEDRYPSGAALMQDLQQAIAAPAPVEKPPSTAPRMTIPDRVKLQAGARPLPPPPSDAFSVISVSERPAAPKPALPASPPVQAGRPASSGSHPAKPADSLPSLASVQPKTWMMVGGIGGSVVILLLLCIVGYLLMSMLGDQTPTPSAAAVIEKTTAGAVTAVPAETADAPQQTPAPTSEQAVPPPSTEISTATEFRLSLYRREKESLYIVNSGTQEFFMGLLQLGNNPNWIDAQAWEDITLQSGQCVAVLGNGKQRPPEGLECETVAFIMVDPDKGTFWKEPFYVFYDGQPVGECKGGEDDKDKDKEGSVACEIVIPAAP